MKLFFIMFGIIFCLAFGIIIFVIVKGVSQWGRNNKSPVLSVNATVVSKRTSVSSNPHTSDGNTFYASSTNYYVTFQVESGDRLEFLVRGTEFGQLCEGDNGKLTFQGTRYLGFERKFVNI